jgi:hypothetical protein
MIIPVIMVAGMIIPAIAAGTMLPAGINS